QGPAYMRQSLPASFPGIRKPCLTGHMWERRLRLRQPLRAIRRMLVPAPRLLLDPKAPAPRFAVRSPAHSATSREFRLLRRGGQGKPVSSNPPVHPRTLPAEISPALETSRLAENLLGPRSPPKSPRLPREAAHSPSAIARGNKRLR